MRTWLKSLYESIFVCILWLGITLGLTAFCTFIVTNIIEWTENKQHYNLYTDADNRQVSLVGYFAEDVMPDVVEYNLIFGFKGNDETEYMFESKVDKSGYEYVRGLEGAYFELGFDESNKVLLAELGELSFELKNYEGLGTGKMQEVWLDKPDSE